MPTLRSKATFTVSVGACLVCALLILMLPLQWIVAAAAAALFHEAFHALAVQICGSRVLSVRVGQQGTKMQAPNLTAGRELFCMLAGPLGSLLLLLFVRLIPRIAFCAAVHGVYNLLPLSHLDGGKALYAALRMLCPAKSQIIAASVQRGVLILLWILAIYLAIFSRLGLFPLIFMLTLSAAAKKDLANRT